MEEEPNNNEFLIKTDHQATEQSTTQQPTTEPNPALKQEETHPKNKRKRK